MPNARHRLEARLSGIEGVVLSESMFGNGDAYWCHGKEIVHFEHDGRVEVRLTRAVIRERRSNLRADDRVELRRSGADWITVRCESDGDVALVAELAEVAASVHRPPPGVPPKPPPTGAELRRRQRFH